MRYALHRRAIKNDIADLKADWALEEYYRAGVIAADLAYLAVGPVVVPTFTVTEENRELPDPVGMPVRAPYEFASGFAFGFTEVNDLTAFELCYTQDAASFKYVKSALAQIVEGNIEAALADLALFGQALPTDVATCEAAKIDLVAVENWAQIFKNKAALTADITMRYALHRRAIKADIAELKADWALEEFYQAGFIAADLAYLAVGPVVV